MSVGELSICLFVALLGVCAGHGVQSCAWCYYCNFGKLLIEGFMQRGWGALVTGLLDCVVNYHQICSEFVKLVDLLKFQVSFCA